MSELREYVLAHMEAQYAEHGQRLFWLSGFNRDEFKLRCVINELDTEGVVEWRLSTICPQCEREWGGHPKDAPRRCRICGYDTLAEEGPQFFLPNSFAWKREAAPVVDVAALRERAEKAERERDELRTAHKAACQSLGIWAAEVSRLTAEIATLKAEKGRSEDEFHVMLERERALRAQVERLTIAGRAVVATFAGDTEVGLDGAEMLALGVLKRELDALSGT